MNERPADELLPAIHELDDLTDEQRVKVFAMYCRHCGDKDPRCQCWNDE